MRDSKDLTRPALRIAAGPWAAFLGGSVHGRR
ncbi:DUF397 domain-containing protein [Streptomyces sp. NPDC047525]